MEGICYNWPFHVTELKETGHVISLLVILKARIKCRFPPGHLQERSQVASNFLMNKFGHKT